MTEEATQLDPYVPQITTKILGMGEVDIEVNKLATMVEGWCKEYLDQHMINIQETLDKQDTSIQDILDDFYQGILKYLKVGLIASINISLIGFGWFLRTILD
ncbi:hypothetical protein LCGC14_1501870 [marine sediment metagenome]|uniref:Uncharacterized protein n=1 Tax=marine sediment metagenome TaxID=412755 RepID=A0A0F9J3X3_9ZZZZ